MSLQVEKLEKNMAKLTIEVPAEELEKAIDNAYRKNRKKISVPGFRKGKVPRQMIEKMYGKEIFYEDAINELLLFKTRDKRTGTDGKRIIFPFASFKRNAIHEPFKIEHRHIAVFYRTVFHCDIPCILRRCNQ